MIDKYLPSDKRARAAIGIVATILATLLFAYALPGRGGVGQGTPYSVLFNGLVLGTVLSLYTVGILLIYRTFRVINFAIGALGSVGAGFALQLVALTPVPFPAGFAIGVLVSIALGAIVGVFLLRFFNAARLFITVVTIVGAGAFQGLSEFLQRLPIFPKETELTTAEIDGLSSWDRHLPFQGFNFSVGDFNLPFGFAHLFALDVAILVLLGVAAFLRYTKSGTAVRALAENSERASLLGIGVGGISVLVWVLVGAIDGVASQLAIMAAPDIAAGQVGLAILLVPFVAAVLARFESLPVAVGATIALATMRQAFFFNFPQTQETFDILLVGGTIVVLFLQRKRLGRSEGSGGTSWAATDEPRPVPKELAGVTPLRVARISFIAIGLIAVVAFPFIASTARIVLAGVIICNAICVLSLVVLTGWAGQISLAQWAFVGIGSVVGGALTGRAGWNFWLAMPITVVITAAVAVVVGLPALRIKGLFLLVTTFGFALVISQTLFDTDYFDWLLPETVTRPTLFFLNFEEEKSMYFLLVVSLVAVIAVVRNLRRSRIGRVLIALRENEPNVQAFGISAVRAKLTAFAIAGAIAGFSGFLFAHHQRGVAAASFAFFRNIEVFTQAVIGGVSSPAGALLGSAYIQIPRDLIQNNDIAQAIFTSFGPLLFLFIAPGGFISVLNKMRDSVLRIVAQRRRIVVPSLFADYDPDALARQLIPLAEGQSGTGLSALPIDRRFALESELYQGPGERIVEKLGPGKQDREAAAIGAAVQSIGDLELVAAEER